MKEENQTWWYLLQKEIDHNFEMYKKVEIVEDYSLVMNKSISDLSFAYSVRVNGITLLCDILNYRKVNGVPCELVKLQGTSCCIATYEDATADDICLEILTAFHARKVIADREYKLAEIIAPELEYIPADGNEDDNGIDGYVRERNKKRLTPLQQKPSLSEFREHAKMYPHIPLIGWTSKSPRKDVKAAVRRIIRAHENKEILHLFVAPEPF